MLQYLIEQYKKQNLQQNTVEPTSSAVYDHIQPSSSAVTHEDKNVMRESPGVVQTNFVVVKNEEGLQESPGIMQTNYVVIKKEEVNG